MKIRQQLSEEARSESEPLKVALVHLFGAEPTPAEVDLVCRKYKIDFLIARRNHPAWRGRGSWVWTRKTLIQMHWQRRLLSTQNNSGNAAIAIYLVRAFPQVGGRGPSRVDSALSTTTVNMSQTSRTV